MGRQNLKNTVYISAYPKSMKKYFDFAGGGPLVFLNFASLLVGIKKTIKRLNRSGGFYEWLSILRYPSQKPFISNY